jgi:hypothetical protein
MKMAKVSGFVGKTPNVDGRRPMTDEELEAYLDRLAERQVGKRRPRSLDVYDTGNVLGCSSATVVSRIKEGALLATEHSGGTWTVDLEDLRAYREVFRLKTNKINKDTGTDETLTTIQTGIQNMGALIEHQNGLIREQNQLIHAIENDLKSSHEVITSLLGRVQRIEEASIQYQNKITKMDADLNSLHDDLNVKR